MRTAVLFGVFVGRYADGFVIRQLPALPDPFLVAAFPSSAPGNDLDGTSVRVLNRRPRPLRQLDRLATSFATRRAHNERETTGMLADRTARRLLRDASVAYAMFAWNAEPFLRTLRTRTLAELPLVVHAGGTDVTRAAQVGLARDRMLAVADRAAMVTCSSQFLHSSLLGLGLPAERVRVHSVGIPTGRIPRHDHDARDSPLVVTSVGRLSPVKGVDQTVRAFARAASSEIPMRLDVVGDGKERPRLVALVNELGIADRVQFIGHVTQEEAWARLAAADVYLQHNMTCADGSVEALGGSILEASAAEIPVIVARSGGATEAVVDGETGYLVDEGDVDGMAERLVALAHDPDTRATLGRAGRAFVRSHHDLVAQNVLLGEALRDVATTRSTRSSVDAR